MMSTRNPNHVEPVYREGLKFVTNIHKDDPNLICKYGSERYQKFSDSYDVFGNNLTHKGIIAVYEIVLEEIQISIEQQEKIYKFYALNFKDKSKNFRYSWQFGLRVLVNTIASNFTFGLVKYKYFCPRCSNVIGSFTHKYHPIHVCGCNNCRERIRPEGELLI